MHRLHEDDLTGHVLAQEDWEVVRFPAIAEEDEMQLLDTVWGHKRVIRRQGEAAHPAREGAQMLERIRPNDRRIQFRRSVPADTRYQPQ